MNTVELFNVPLPEKTQSYSPVAHQFIDELIEDKIKHSGLQIVGKRYKVASGGNQAVGLIDLKADSGTFNYSLGWQNSYDKTRPVSFVAGTIVIACTNGMLLGDSKFIRKHTGEVMMEMSDRIDEVMYEVKALLNQSIDYRARMQIIELDTKATAELCGRLFMEQDIINSTQLNIIRGNYHAPGYWEEVGHSLWNFYNHTTHALKTTHPYNYLVNHKKLQQFVETEFNF